MKLIKYKYIGFLFAAFFISSLHAQKFDRKFKENFKVNKDVLVAIKANNADINVTTWNKNEVAVEAVITVEGLSKKEAQKYLNSWDFEALGNKKKVSINTNGDRFVYFGDSSFNFDFDMPEIVIPDMKFDFDFSDLEIPEIIIPDMDFNFQNIWDDIEEEDFDGEEKSFSFNYKGKQKNVVITSKKQWEEFKKSKEFLELKKSLKESLHRAKEKYRKIDKKKIKEKIKKAQIAVKGINEEKLKKSLAKARVAIEKMKTKMASKYKNGDNVIIIENGDSKRKVKITKKITVKVPKGAKFDLNTRHSKVKLPKGKTSGKVSYGTFNSDGLYGGDLKIYYAPVDINTLNACTLFLNNVTDANLASVSNTVINTNSSGVKIQNVFNNVDVTNKFGELNIVKIAPNFNTLNLILDSSEVRLPLLNIDSNYNLNTVESRFLFPKNHNKDIFTKILFKALDNKTSSVKGEMSSDRKTNNTIKFNASYSVIKVN
ncbi:MAG: hypothetical protein ACPGUU_07705 [Flavobacteriaceae bacterium]